MGRLIISNAVTVNGAYEAPGIFDDLGGIRLELVATTTFPSGVVRLCYRLAADTPSPG